MSLMSKLGRVAAVGVLAGSLVGLAGCKGQIEMKNPDKALAFVLRTGSYKAREQGKYKESGTLDQMADAQEAYARTRERNQRVPESEMRRQDVIFINDNANIVSVEHNIKQGDEIGMKVKFDYVVTYSEGRTYMPVVYFFKKNGEKLMDRDGIDRAGDGQVAIAGVRQVANYRATTFPGCEIFVGYNRLDIRESGVHGLKLHVGIFDVTDPNSPVQKCNSGTVGIELKNP